MRTLRYLTLIAAIASFCGLSITAHSQETKPLLQVLNLSADAFAEVPNDTVRITFASEAENASSAALSQALNKAADTVLRDAKANPKLEAKSGGYSVYPNNDRNGRITAWRGRIEVVVESKDFAAASEFAGKAGDIMPVANLAFSLSRDARRAQEKRLTDEAIKAFQEKALNAAKAFGMNGYTVVNVSVNAGTNTQPQFADRGMVAMSSKSAAPPVEGGKASVTVNVSGSVQMK